MLDFAVVIPKLGANADHSPQLIGELASLRAARTDHAFAFASGTVRAWAWYTAAPPYLDPLATISTARGLQLYTGYAMADDGRPIASLAGLQADREYRGDYLYLHVGEDGDGRLIRSQVSTQQVYYAENDRCWAFSSRAVIAAVLIHSSLRPPINSGFARWVCSYGVCSNDESLFQSVKFLRLGESIDIRPGEVAITCRSPGFLFSAESKERYHADRRHYWDHAFDRIRDSVNFIDLTDDPIEFPLSGGKDSRLLLALMIAGKHTARIRRIYTNGPPISPEVRSAQAICQVLGLKHEYVDNSNVMQKKEIILSDKLLQHLLISEGEISPMDLIWQRAVQRRTALHGQEGGLRNIAGKRSFASRQEVLTWFRSHLGSGDMCNIYRRGVGEHNLSEIERFVDAAADAGVEWPDIPSWHRVEYRLARWVSRTWKAYNEVSFAPYLFANADVVSATLSAGHQSRIMEEFHFEMIRRAEPRLLSVPFAGQRWEPEMVAQSGMSLPETEPYLWPHQVAPASRRATHEAFSHNIASIIPFIRDNAGPVVRELVDFAKLSRFLREPLLPGHYQPLWQLLQCTIAERIPRWDTFADPNFARDFQLPSVDVRDA